MSQTSDTAVIAIAYRYEWLRHALFVMPLRMHYAGDIILGTEPVEQMDPDIRELGRQQRVTFAPIRHKCAAKAGGVADYYDRKTGKTIKSMNDVSDGCGFHGWLMLIRFQLYADACRPYARCLAMDFRDVIFQADPFAELARLNEAKQDKSASDLVLVCEDSSKQVGASYFNRVWIRQCIGQEFYHRVASSRCIVNSGSIMGTPAAFDRAAVLMATPCVDVNMTTGSDQAKILWAYRDRQFGNLSVEAQTRGRGVVNTMRYALGGMAKLKVIRTLPQSEVRWPKVMPFTVYNDDNATVSSVVHQYDAADMLADSIPSLPRLNLMVEMAALSWLASCGKPANRSKVNERFEDMLFEYYRLHRTWYRQHLHTRSRLPDVVACE